MSIDMAILYASAFKLWYQMYVGEWTHKLTLRFSDENEFSHKPIPHTAYKYLIGAALFLRVGVRMNGK